MGPSERLNAVLSAPKRLRVSLLPQTSSTFLIAEKKETRPSRRKTASRSDWSGLVATAPRSGESAAISWQVRSCPPESSAEPDGRRTAQRLPQPVQPAGAEPLPEPEQHPLTETPERRTRTD